MRADEIGVRFRDGAHSDLVGGAAEKGGESGGERHRPIATRRPDSNASQILLSNEALAKSLWVRLSNIITNCDNTTQGTKSSSLFIDTYEVLF